MTPTAPAWVIMPVLGAPDLTEAAIGDVLAQSLPTRLLVINQGVDTAFRSRLEQIAEQYPGEVFLWSHEPRLPSLAATWNRALRMVWESGAEEALVINNDVRLHHETYAALITARTTTEAWFVTAVGVTEAQFAGVTAAQIRHEALRQRGGPDFSCFLIAKAGHERYPFDEHFIPAYCEDLDLHRRYMLGGDGDKIFSINLPFHHVGGGSGTLKSFTPEQKAAHERKIGQSRDYYAKKWGGPVNQERYTIPFDASTSQDGVTTPELQRICQAAMAEQS